MIRRRTALGALAGALVAAVARAQAPAEPDDYRRDAYRSPTPATLRGAQVVTTAEAEALWHAGAVFVDVLPQPPRPEGLAPGALWRPPPRDTIRGATWLANVGFGDLAPQTEAYFRRGLAAATEGQPAKPVVLFCLRHCWMSWNAAKRAIAMGYTSVHWYPDGTDGWGEAHLPLQRVEPAPSG